MADWLPERAPYQLGDTVWLVKDVFEIGLDTLGIVVNEDVLVARAYEVGMDSCGIVEVEFAAAHRRVQSHWTNFTANPPLPVPPQSEAIADWQPIETAPENVDVLTKIDDGAGVRNEQPLKRQGRLWFVPDMSMYVYYRPTHWKPLTER